MKKIAYALFCLFLVGFAAYAQQTSMTIGGGGSGVSSATTCTNQFIRSLSLLGVGTCASVNLANDTAANQGTINQVLRGNASGQPSFGNLSVGQLVNIGTGTATGTLSGTLVKAAPNVSTVGTTEEIMATITVPANTLAYDGGILHVVITFLTKNNGNTKAASVRLNGIGGTPVVSLASSAYNNQLARIDIMIQSVSATSVSTVGYTAVGPNGNPAGSGFTVGMGAVSPTLSSQWTLDITGTTANAAGDLTLKSYAAYVIQ